LFGSAAYHEIAPHIVLMAFLHRVVNGGGTIEREYAIGRDRMDLCLRYKNLTLGIELKAWYNKKGDPLEDGLEQLESYLARLEVDFGWLIIFDQRSKAPPIEERLTTQITITKNGRSVTVVLTSSDSSDISFLIDYELQKITAWFPVGLIHDLENLLNRKVDVVTTSSLHSFTQDKVFNEAILL
jgi:hypothetical protein